MVKIVKLMIMNKMMKKMVLVLIIPGDMTATAQTPELRQYPALHTDFADLLRFILIIMIIVIMFMIVMMINMIIPSMRIQGGGLVITPSQTAKETLIQDVCFST